MKRLIIISLLFLTACTTTMQPPTIVKVPIAIKQAAPTIPAKPYLPIYTLTEASTPADVMKAYVASLVALEGHADALTAVLAAYR